MKKRVLVDINVVLDLLLDRKPHVAASAAVCAAVEKGKTDGLLAAHAVTTIHYLLSRQLGQLRAKQSLQTILKIFTVAPVDDNVIHHALRASGPDFEDAVTAAAAQASGCDLIVTRDPKGFRGSPVTVLNPEEALPLLR